MLARDSFVLGQFDLCQLLLMNDANYPWFILVPKVENIQEIFQLSPEHQLQLLKESSELSQAIHKAFQAHKLNVAALGNVCPQLHIHHIVRYTTDPAWPKPVWGNVPAKQYAEPTKAALIEKLKPSLTKSFSWF